MDRILITGGAGFIGSYLVDMLTNAGYYVIVLDNLSEQIHGKMPENSFLYKKIKDKVTFIKGDVRSTEDIKKAFSYNPDMIYHFAAETGTGQSMYNILNYTDVNVQGTANLLQTIADDNCAVKRVILSSSRAVYGEGAYLCSQCGIVTPKSRKVEDMRNGNWDLFCPNCGSCVQPISTKESTSIDPQSIYAVTKATQEMLIKNFCSAYNISYVILRFQNVYGVGQSLCNPYTGVLAAFVTRLIYGHGVEVFENGKEARDFINVRDVARACFLSLNKKSADNNIINIGSGAPTTIYKIAEILSEYFDVNVKPTINGKFRIGDIFSCYADVSLAEKLLQFKPTVKIIDGLSEFAKWSVDMNPEEMDLYSSLEELKEKGLLKE